ncbi:MAG: transposase [Clostridia bacterium]|nr:transposase [Clostridia bacterium]
MLNDNIKVPMPTERIVIRKLKDIYYVYYRTRAYRNAKGQPTNDTVLIGKKDLESGMLIPNKKYYEIYDIKPMDTIESNEKAENELIPETILDYGNNYLLDHLLEKYDVNSTLKYAFPDLYKEIATLAKYMLCEGNVYYYCEDWCDKTHTGLPKSISSQKSSEICKSISLKQRTKFFKRWIYAREKEEYLAYDITSISSYSTGNDNVEWGYNRDEEALPQINMGMIFGESTKIPVYYNVYPGSIPDKSYLDYMLRDSEEIGLKYSKFVMDKGFFSEYNLKRLAKETLHFIVSVPNHHNIPKRLINENARMQYDSRNSLGSGKPYAKCATITDYGFRANVHVFFDTMKFHDESAILLNNIERREQALSTLTAKPSEPHVYDKYFIFKESKKAFSFERNTTAINNAIAGFGYFLILTTDFNLTSNEVLEIYRRKDVVEKCFDNLKNAIDMKRLRTHSTESSDGKMFIAFVSLILRSILENTIGEFNRKNNLTIEKVMKELSKIRVVHLSNGTSLLNPITKKQRMILENFGLTEEDILKSVISLKP